MCDFESRLPQEFLQEVEALRHTKAAGQEADWAMFVAVAKDRLSGAAITTLSESGASTISPHTTRDGISVLCKKTRPRVQNLLKGSTEGLTSVGGRGFWSQGTEDRPWSVGTEDRVTIFSHTCPMHSVYAKLAQE